MRNEYNGLTDYQKLFWRDINTNNPYQYNYNSPYGNNIIIEHGYMFENTFISAGFYSHYSHLTGGNFNNLSVGQYINSNTLLDYRGNTGASTGSHVDYEIYSKGKDELNYYLSKILGLKGIVPPKYYDIYYNLNDLY